MPHTPASARLPPLLAPCEDTAIAAAPREKTTTAVVNLKRMKVTIGMFCCPANGESYVGQKLTMFALFGLAVFGPDQPIGLALSLMG